MASTDEAGILSAVDRRFLKEVMNINVSNFRSATAEPEANGG